MRCLLFIWILHCCKTLAAYPSTLDEPPLVADILSIAPHRVYLVSLQPNCTCFLLHLSSSHDGRLLTFMLLFDVRTFLPQFLGINKLFFSWSAKIRKFDVIIKSCDDVIMKSWEGFFCENIVLKIQKDSELRPELSGALFVFCHSERSGRI